MAIMGLFHELSGKDSKYWGNRQRSVNILLLKWTVSMVGRNILGVNSVLRVKLILYSLVRFFALTFLNKQGFLPSLLLWG